MHPLIAVPATAALIIQAYRRQSLTPLGLVVATLTAVIHAIHPWNVFFALLVVFFIAGTKVTKIKHEVKAHLTLSSAGASGEGPRTHIQVLANSAVASGLILLHCQKLLAQDPKQNEGRNCWSYQEDPLVVGIVSNYAAVAADTFSSELGILSKRKPRLLTSWNLRPVPPGTNGGVTVAGTLAGFAGALTIALTSSILLPFCPVEHRPASNLTSHSGWGITQKGLWILAITLWGGMGSLLDSLLGGWFQASVVDVRTGKVIEGIGGKKVLVVEHATRAEQKEEHKSRKIESGSGVLDNNTVNFLMALLMSLGGMLLAARIWDVPVSRIFT